MGGYKATLKSKSFMCECPFLSHANEAGHLADPHASQEAKDHAKAVLEEHKAL